MLDKVYGEKISERKPATETDQNRKTLTVKKTINMGSKRKRSIFSAALILALAFILTAGMAVTSFADDLTNTVPSDESYTTSISTYLSTHNFNNNYGPTYGPFTVDGVVQSQSPSSATTFAAGLPLGTISIDQSKIGPTLGKVDIVSNNTNIIAGLVKESNGKVGYDGTKSGAIKLLPNKVNKLEGDLFTVKFEDAAVLPDGDTVDLVITYSNARIVIDQRYAYAPEGDQYLHGIAYLAWGNRFSSETSDKTDFRKVGYKDAAESAVKTTATYFGNTFTNNDAAYPVVGTSLDATYSIVNKDGTPRAGSFVFAMAGINLDRDPDKSMQNNANKPLWYSYKDNFGDSNGKEYSFFSEAMSVDNKGQKSTNIYIRPNNEKEDNPDNISGLKGQYFWPNVSKDSKNKIRFISNAVYNDNTDYSGHDSSYNAGFVTLADAAQGITVTRTGHGGGTYEGNMNTPAFNSKQIWYRYTSSSGSYGTIQTTSEGNYTGQLNDGGDVLDPGTYVVTEGKTITYTMTPDVGYKLSTLKLNGSEVKFNNASVSRMKKGDSLTETTAAGNTATLKYEENGTYTFKLEHAAKDERVDVTWESTTADILSYKIWKDSNDKDGMRALADSSNKLPKFKLQQSTDGGRTWADVEKNAINANIEDQTVPNGKDSNTDQYLDGTYVINNDTNKDSTDESIVKHPYTWEYLPVYLYDSNGRADKMITYRIVEDPDPGIADYQYAKFKDAQSFELLSEEYKSVDGWLIYTDSSGKEYVNKGDAYYVVTDGVVSGSAADPQPTGTLTPVSVGSDKKINGLQVYRDSSDSKEYVKKAVSSEEGGDGSETAEKYFEVIYDKIVTFPAIKQPTDSNLSAVKSNGYRTADYAAPYQSVSVINEHTARENSIEVSKTWNDSEVKDKATTQANGNNYARRDIRFVLSGKADGQDVDLNGTDTTGNDLTLEIKTTEGNTEETAKGESGDRTWKVSEDQYGAVFDNLPTHSGGKLITYTVKEQFKNGTSNNWIDAGTDTIPWITTGGELNEVRDESTREVTGYTASFVNTAVIDDVYETLPLTIQKKDGYSSTHGALEGAEFTVYTNTGSGIKAVDSSDRLRIDGQKIYVNADGSAEYVLRGDTSDNNIKKYYTFSEESSGSFTYTLADPQPNANSLKVKAAAVKENVVTTGTGGQTTINFLQPGTYYVVETKAPLGYDADTTVYEFKADDSLKTITLESADSDDHSTSWWKRLWDLLFNSGVPSNVGDRWSPNTNRNGGTLTVYDEPYKASVLVQKYWDDNNDQDGVRPKDGDEAMPKAVLKWTTSAHTADGLPLYKSTSGNHEYVHKASGDDFKYFKVTSEDTVGSFESQAASTQPDNPEATNETCQGRKVYKVTQSDSGSGTTETKYVYVDGAYHQVTAVDTKGTVEESPADPQPAESNLTLVMNEGSDWSVSSLKESGSSAAAYANASVTYAGGPVLTHQHDAYTWNSVPAYIDGKPVTYRVFENSSIFDEGGTYTMSFSHTSESAERVFTLINESSGSDSSVTVHNQTVDVTNRHATRVINLEAYKLWNDEDTSGRKETTVRLWKTVNGARSVVTKTAGGNISDDTGTVGTDASPDSPFKTWKDLPAYENGYPITYTIEEDSVSGYKTSYEVDYTEVTSSEESSVTGEQVVKKSGASIDASKVKRTYASDGNENTTASFRIENDKTIDLTVKKTWEAGANANVEFELWRTTKSLDKLTSSALPNDGVICYKKNDSSGNYISISDYNKLQDSDKSAYTAVNGKSWSPYANASSTETVDGWEKVNTHEFNAALFDVSANEDSKSYTFTDLPRQKVETISGYTVYKDSSNNEYVRKDDNKFYEVTNETISDSEASPQPESTALSVSYLKYNYRVLETTNLARFVSDHSFADQNDSGESLTVKNYNVHASNGVANVEVVKELSGREWTDRDKFYFEIVPDNADNPMPTRILRGRTIYQVSDSESSGSGKKYVQDADGLYREVTVTGSGDSTAYSIAKRPAKPQPDESKLTATTETINGETGIEYPIASTNDTEVGTAGRAADFKVIEFDQSAVQNGETKTFTYKVSEVYDALGTSLDDATNHTGTKDGITYSGTVSGSTFTPTEHTLKIVAKSDTSGKITTEIFWDDASTSGTTPVYVNKYDAKADVTSYIIKHVQGREFANGDSFKIFFANLTGSVVRVSEDDEAITTYTGGTTATITNDKTDAAGKNTWYEPVPGGTDFEPAATNSSGEGSYRAAQSMKGYFKLSDLAHKTADGRATDTFLYELYERDYDSAEDASTSANGNDLILDTHRIYMKVVITDNTDGTLDVQSTYHTDASCTEENRLRERVLVYADDVEGGIVSEKHEKGDLAPRGASITEKTSDGKVLYEYVPAAIFTNTATIDIPVTKEWVNGPAVEDVTLLLERHLFPLSSEVSLDSPSTEGTLTGDDYVKSEEERWTEDTDFWQTVGNVHIAGRGDFFNENGTPKYSDSSNTICKNDYDGIEGFNKDLPKYVTGDGRNGTTKGTVYRAVYKIVEDDTSDAYTTSYRSIQNGTTEKTGDQIFIDSGRMVVTNKVVATNTANVAAVKQLQGREWKTSDDFEFTLEPAGKAVYGNDGRIASVDGSDEAKAKVPMPADDTERMSVTSDGIATTHAKKSTTTVDQNGGLERLARFGAITFKVTDLEYDNNEKHYQGDFFYVMKENVPDGGKKDGITYDSTEHTVHIKVRENRTGTLVVQIGYDETTQGDVSTGTLYTPVYTNKYDASGSGSAWVRKRIMGRYFKSGEDIFDFTITPIGGAPFTEANANEFKYSADEQVTDEQREEALASGGLAIRTDDGAFKIRLAYKGDEDRGLTKNDDGSINIESYNDYLVENVNDKNSEGQELTTFKRRLYKKLPALKFELSDLSNKTASDSELKYSDGSSVPAGTAYDEFTYAIKETDCSDSKLKMDTDTEYVKFTVIDKGDGTLDVSSKYYEDRYCTVPRHELNNDGTEKKDGNGNPIDSIAAPFVNQIKRDLSVTKAWAGPATDDVTLILQWSVDDEHWYNIDRAEFASGIETAKIIAEDAEGKDLTVTWKGLPAYANIVDVNNQAGDHIDTNDRWLYYQVVESPVANAEIRYNTVAYTDGDTMSTKVSDAEDAADKYSEDPHHTGEEYKTSSDAAGSSNEWVDEDDRVRQLYVTNFPVDIEGKANIGVVKEYIGKTWDDEAFTFEITPVKSKLGGASEYTDNDSVYYTKKNAKSGESMTDEVFNALAQSITKAQYDALGSDGLKAQYDEHTNSMPDRFNGSDRTTASKSTTKVSVNEHSAEFGALTIRRSDLAMDTNSDSPTHGKLTGEFIYKIKEVLPDGALETNEICGKNVVGNDVKYYVADDAAGNKIKYTTEEHTVKVHAVDDGSGVIDITVSYDDRNEGEFVPVYTNYALMTPPFEGSKTWVGGESSEHQNGTVALDEEGDIVTSDGVNITSDGLGLKLKRHLDIEDASKDVYVTKDDAGRDLEFIWVKSVPVEEQRDAYVRTTDTTVDNTKIYYSYNDETYEYNTVTPEGTANPDTEGWYETKTETVITGYTYEKQENGNGTYTLKAKVTDDQGNVSYTDPYLLKVDNDGTDYVYSIEEAEVPAGYKASYDGMNVTNTYDVQDSLKVTKIWDDDTDDIYDAEGLRPDYSKVTMHLYKVESATTGEGDSAVTNYSLVQVNKEEKEITTDTKVASGGNAEWTNLPVYDTDGSKIKYVVLEESLAGYKTSYKVPGESAVYTEESEAVKNAGYNGLYVELDGNTSSEPQNIEVKNELVPGTSEVSVTKIWDDNSNVDGKRPEDGVKFQLYERVWNKTDKAYEAESKAKYADGTEVPVLTLDGTADEGSNKAKELAPDDSDPVNKWNGKFTGLAATKNGKTVIYYVKEITDLSSAGYQTSVITGNQLDGFTVTNSRDQNTVNAKITKKWDDKSNYFNNRPKTVTFRLMRTYGDDNNKVTEQAPRPSDSSGEKKVEIKLSADDEDPDPANTWSKTIRNLPKNILVEETAGGVTRKVSKPITYFWQEDIPTGYTAKASSNNSNASAEEGWISVDNEGTVINTMVTGTLTLTKTWNDSENAEGLRPDVNDYISKLRLFAGKTEISEFNGTDAHGVSSSVVAGTGEDTGEYTGEYTVTYSGLPVFDSNGEKITYKVEEGAIEGYSIETGANLSATLEKTTDGTEGGGSTYTGSMSVTNKHTPETTTVEVTKNWFDAEDSNGSHAHMKTTDYANHVVLYRDGTEVKDGETYVRPTVTVPSGEDNSDDGANAARFTLKWENLPKYKLESGTRKEIVYTVKEDADIDGYADITENDPVSQDGVSVYDNKGCIDQTNKNKLDAAYNGGEINNIQLISIDVVKKWDDNNDHDGKRPDSIKVKLFRNGKDYRDVLTLNKSAATNSEEGNTYTWSKAWNDLPYADRFGVPYNYTAVEIENSAWYEALIGNQKMHQVLLSTWNSTYDTLTFELSNKHDPEKISFTVDKIWDDNNDIDGLRPGTITYKLYQQPKDEAKTQVTALPEGASISYANDDVITMAENGDITVNTNKDDKNQGVLGRIIFKNLPKYARVKTSAEGVTPETYESKEITYSIEEAAVRGYNLNDSGEVQNVNATGTQATGFTVTNTHDPVHEDVTPQIHKDITGRNFRGGAGDASSEKDEFTFLITPQSGAPRPVSDHVTISNLSGNSVEVILPTIRITGSDMKDELNEGQTKTFTYHVTEVNGGKTYNDLTYSSQTLVLTVVAERNEDGSIHVKSTSWSGGDGEQDDAFTNIYQGNTHLTLRKVWIDDDADNTVINVRPVSVVLTVRASVTSETQSLVDHGFTKQAETSADEKKIYTKQVTLTGNATASKWEDETSLNELPKYDASGELIDYNVSEDRLPNFKEPEVEKKGNLFIVTNTYDSTSFTGTKKWVDGKVHDNATELKEKLILQRSTTPSDDSSWSDVTGYHIHWNNDGQKTDSSYTQSFTITGLPKEQSKDVYYVYRVKENLGTEYEIYHKTYSNTENESTSEFKEADQTDALYNGGELINTAGDVEIGGDKTWVGGTESEHVNANDSGDALGLKLYRHVKGSDAEPEPVTTDNNGKTLVVEWNHVQGNSSYVFKAKGSSGTEPVKAVLDQYDGSHNEYIYTVKETNVPDNYHVTYHGLDITNTSNEKQTITATKEWAGDENDKTHRRSVSLQLYQTVDGATKAVGQAVVVAKGDDYATDLTATWEDMPLYEGDNKITYTVEETDVPDGYTSKVEYGVTVGEGEMPQWTDKPGEKWNYQVKVTNTLETDKATVVVQKKWDDNENEDGTRPNEVVVSLKAGNDSAVHLNGDPVDDIKLNDDNNWKNAFTNLPKTDSSGSVIDYKVEEHAVNDYTTSCRYGSKVEGDSNWHDSKPGENGENWNYKVLITNRHNTGKTDITATKVWQGDEAVGTSLRSDVILHLYGIDGNNLIVYDAGTKKIKADATEAERTVTWTDIPKRHYDSNDLTWTVVEEPVFGYTSVVTGDAENGFTVTNTYTGPTAEVTVSKEWKDTFYENYSVRPDKVTYELWKKVGNNDPVKADEIAVNVEYDGSASYKWTDLPVTEEVKTGGSESSDRVEYQQKTAAAGESGTDEKLVYRKLDTGEEVEYTETDYNALSDESKSNLEPVMVPVPVEETKQTTKEEPVLYTVKEQKLDATLGYLDPIIEATDTPGVFKAVNIHETKLVSYDVVKVWNDNDDADKMRPDHLTVRLMNGNTEVRKYVLTKDDKDGEEKRWKHSFMNVPATDENGEPITYSLVEDNVEGYNAVYDPDPINTLKKLNTNENGQVNTITNTHQAGSVVALKAVKQWSGDSGDQSKRKPVKFHLVKVYDDGNADNTIRRVVYASQYDRTADENNNWTATWDYKLPTHEKGKKIYWTVEEETVEGYKGTIGDVKESYVEMTPADGDKPKAKGWYEKQVEGDTEKYVRTDDETPQNDKTYYAVTFEVVVTNTLEQTVNPGPGPSTPDDDRVDVIYVDPKNPRSKMVVQSTSYDSYEKARAAAYDEEVNTPENMDNGQGGSNNNDSSGGSNNNDGSNVRGQSADFILSAQAVPKDPSHEGVQFIGWDINYDENENFVLVAMYSDIPDDVTPVVSYVDGQAKDPLLVSVITDDPSSVKAPKDPKHKNFIFAGWKKTVDAGGNTIFVASYKVKNPGNGSSGSSAGDTNANTTGSGKGTKTGDNNAEMVLWILVLIMSAALLGIYVADRKRSYKK